MEETLNTLEATILRILEGHLGADNPVSRAELVDRVNQHYPLSPIHDRQIRLTIKHLICQHGAAIGSCHWGYFMAATPQEIEGVCKYYDSYGLSSLYVAAKLRKIEMAEYLGQLSIKFTCRRISDQ